MLASIGTVPVFHERSIIYPWTLRGPFSENSCLLYLGRLRLFKRLWESFFPKLSFRHSQHEKHKAPGPLRLHCAWRGCGYIYLSLQAAIAEVRRQIIKPKTQLTVITDVEGNKTFETAKIFFFVICSFYEYEAKDLRSWKSFMINIGTGGINSTNF